MLYGSNPQAVINHIRERAESIRCGNHRPDGRKLALVIEGGGMRSVCSGAGAAALGQLGLHNVFDEVYATSAGVMNAGYFLTNQPLLGMSVYFENCTTWSFLNPFRFWKVINVDYIVDEVAAREKRLDWEVLATLHTRLLVSVCDIATGQPLLIDLSSTNTAICQVLKAAMAIPVLYNQVVSVDGRQCIDYGTILPFPLHESIERHCTDILVLSTRSASYSEKPPTVQARAVFGVVHARGRPELSMAFAGRHKVSQKVRDMAIGRIESPANVNIAAICPKEDACLESMTTNKQRTYRAAISFGMDTLKHFGEDPLTFNLPEFT